MFDVHVDIMQTRNQHVTACIDRHRVVINAGRPDRSHCGDDAVADDDRLVRQRDLRFHRYDIRADKGECAVRRSVFEAIGFLCLLRAADKDQCDDG